LLSLLCIWLIFVIAGRLFGQGVARITLFLSAINVGFLVYAQLLLAETLMLTFLLFFFERFTVFLREQKVGQLAQAGLVLGLSVLIKPMALLFVFLLLPFIWFCGGRRCHDWSISGGHDFLGISIASDGAGVSAAGCEVHEKKNGVRQKFLYVFVLLVSFYLPLLGYMGYNYVTFGHFRYAPMTSLNIYQCFLSKVIAHVERQPVEQVRTQTLVFTGEHGFDERGWDVGRKLLPVYLKQHSFVFISVWCMNVIKTIFGLYATQLKLLLNPALVGGQHSFFKFSGTLCEQCVAYVMGGVQNPVLSWIALCEMIFNGVRWLLVFFACFLLARAGSWCVLYLFGSYTFQCTLVTGIDGCCRYRMTFEPILIILAAIGIYALYKKW
jgi:hypothetical protein